MAINNGRNQNQSPGDGQNFTHTALQEMGIAPGDIGEFMREFRKNSGMMAGGPQKLARTVEEKGEDKQSDTLHDQEQANEERRLEQQRQDNERWDREQSQQKEHQIAQRLEEQRIADAKAAENRPAEDQRTMGIAMLPLGLASMGIGLGLTKEAVTATGNMLSARTAGLANPVLDTGNSGGTLLAGARNALGINGPGAGQDMAVTGPNRLNPLTPGAAPKDPAPGMNAPGQFPGYTPSLPA